MTEYVRPTPGSALDFTRFEALTFDCYGTLIDWERGILSALQTLLGDPSSAGGSVVGDDVLLSDFARFEPEAEHGTFRRYREVMEDVARRFGAHYGVEVTDDAAGRFAQSVADWPPFPDTIAALETLGGAYRLAIASNVDDDLFAGSAAQLGINFDEIVTAQQVKSYKPAPRHFHEVLRRLELPVDRVLHVAQSVYHDIEPALELGFTCVWVNRRSDHANGGATPPAEATPDLEVPSLAALVEAAGLA
jgi:2-haloacid dehalogenase